MVLPWKDECQTLDFNLKRDLDKRTTDKVTYENSQLEAIKTGSVNAQVEHEVNTGLNSGINWFTLTILELLIFLFTIYQTITKLHYFF